jgi:hypothetical protein
MTASETSRSEAGANGFEDVCTLPRDELRERVAVVRRDILSQTTRRETLTDGMAFEFAATPAMKEQLEELVEFERECCSGLDWNLGRVGPVLRLSVRGLAPDSDALRASDIAPGGRVPASFSRLARAGGLGAAAALFLCCVAPIGVAVVAGAALAAPLAVLDQPLVIAATFAVVTATTWLWLGRRAARHAATGCTDCG